MRRINAKWTARAFTEVCAFPQTEGERFLVIVREDGSDVVLSDGRTRAQAIHDLAEALQDWNGSAYVAKEAPAAP